MKVFFRNILLLVSIFFLLHCQNGVRDVRDNSFLPNLILIIADDMAWDDCGAYGHPAIKTPNIDRLAKDGMLFHQAYLTASSCSPSRASIITGTYPHQTDAEQLHWPLPANKTTFVQELKKAGYWTAQAGKWHFGDFIVDHFDYRAPVGTGGFVYNPNQKETEPAVANDGSGCQEWVPTLRKRPKDRPFFLWLAAVDPHRPYEDRTKSVHREDMVRIPPYLPDNAAVRKDFTRYYDEIHRMDRYIGDVIAELEREGLSQSTCILFISDNGRPFPREKTTLYDGGIKTPWIVKWPARVSSGSATNALVSSVDIAPTFLTLAGLTPDSAFLGKDFSKILLNPTNSLRNYIYAEDHWHDFEDYARAIRTKKYKYIRNFYPDLPNTPPADALRSPTFQSMRQLRDENKLTNAQRACFTTPRPAEELYDMQADPHELSNLAENPDYESILKEMRQYLEEIRTITEDRLPSKRTADEFDRETGEPLPNRIRPRPSKKEMTK